MEILNPREEQAMGELEEQEESREYLADSENFSENIEEWNKEGRPGGERFILGSTGDALQGLGAIESDIYIQGDKIKTILAEHPEMSITEIKRLPEIINNPSLILKSMGKHLRGNNTRMVMYGNVRNNEGQPVLAILDLKPVEKGFAIMDMQKVTSSYVKTQNPQDFIKNSEVMYFENKRATKLLSAIGLQLRPIAFELSGYTGSIQYKDDAVKLEGTEFTNVFTDSEVQDQARTKSFSDREVLTLAAEGVNVEGLTETESKALDTFQQRLSKLEQLQIQRHDMGKLYNEQQFHGKDTREEAKKTLNRMHILDDQIKKASDDVLKVEQSEVLRRVLKQARKVVERQERERGNEKLRRYRDRRANFAEIKHYRQEIQKDVDELSKWALHPKNKNDLKHMPEAIKSTVLPFLMSINFSSKKRLRGDGDTKADSQFLDKLLELKRALQNNQDVRGLYSGYNDLPPQFMERLDDFIQRAQSLITNSGVEPDEAGEYVINNMNVHELEDLSILIKNLKALIQNMNKFHIYGIFKHVSDAGDDSIDFMSELAPKKKPGELSNFLFWQQIRPAYAFARFGKGGIAMFDRLREGQKKLAQNTKEIAEFAEKTYTEEEVRQWEKETKVFNIGGTAVEIPIANIMALYCLSKRPQAVNHILHGGIRIATYTDKNGRHSDNREPQGIQLHVLDQIIESLTPRQRYVANTLQSYMSSQGSEWGNYVSVARFGEELFGEKHYFPIHSDGRALPADADEKPAGASLYALLNMSFTKELKEDASNRIIIYSIFDVFAQHMASMAQYNALALPVVDTLKWFNYRQVDIDDRGNKIYGKTVRDEMARAFGAPDEDTPGKGRNGYAEKFVLGILKSFNGTEAQGTPTDTPGVNALHKYNMAQVAYNLRVVVQQPLAITRAAMLISYKSIIKGLHLSPAKIKANIAEMQKYSGIALWKSLGFYDVNISRGLTAVIKHDKGPMEKIGDIGMWGAEQADTITWAAMWSACKEEVAKKTQPGSKKYFDEVTELFEDVIYKTQVVDSVLTKNEFLRSKGFFARAIGSFMSEPTTTASMLLDAYDKYSMDLQRGYSRQTAWQKNGKNIARTVYVYAIGALTLAAAQAVADAWRDDDDYMTFGEKWLDAFKGNTIDELMPLNKLPFFNDFYEVAKSLLGAIGFDTYGNEPRSLWMQWRKSLVAGTEIIYDKLTGKKTNYQWYGGAYKLLQAAAGITGLPIATATREVVNIWNNTAGAISPKLKVKSYEPSETSKIKYAYQDGYLTEEEATKELLDKKLAKNKDAAYWIINGWATGGNKYTRLYNDILEGRSTKEAIAELNEHGVSNKDISSHIRSMVGDDYISSNLNREQAISILKKHCDLDTETAIMAINNWSAEKETGIKYTDITDAYLRGDIGAGEAKKMWTKYGGKTPEEAADKIAIIDFKENHPDINWDSAAISKYKTEIEPQGISVKVYNDYLIGKKKCKGTDLDNDGKTDTGSLKEEVVELINSLPISPAQKDALYRLNGWSERKIAETPWH